MKNNNNNTLLNNTIAIQLTDTYVTSANSISDLFYFTTEAYDKARQFKQVDIITDDDIEYIIAKINEIVTIELCNRNHMISTKIQL